MANPLQSMIKDPQGEGMGKELGESLRMQKEAGDSLKKPSGEPAKPVGAPAPMTPTKGPYGSNPGSGEKRIDTSYPGSPMPKFHQGGTVKKDGPAMLKAGERVLTPEQHGHLKTAMSLAQSALSHEPEKDAPPALPTHLREMHIKEMHTGGFHVQKHDGKGGMTEHVAPHNDSVVGHFMDHMAHPDEDEEAVESGDHDMHAADAEHKAIGG
jgi:hypothetical protein